MSLQARITALAQAVGADIKALQSGAAGGSPPAIRTPANISPAQSATGDTETPTLSGSIYLSLYGLAMVAAQFQVSTTADFGATVVSTGDIAGTATTYTVSAGVLAVSTAYYWRVRYKDVEGVYSAWSAPTSFTTAASFSSYIATPTATPAAFGDPLEGGFYAGMIWNELVQSASSMTIGTGVKTFTVPNMAGAPIVYAGQMLEVRSRANPANKMIGTVVSASGTALAINVDSIGGSGTFSDWSVMSRFRVIVAPKAGGENPGVMIKAADTAVGVASQTSSEGLRSTLSMVAAGGVSVYPAANWARSLVLGGRTDWYIPARDELELLWRNLKPTTNDNFVSVRRVASVYDYRRDGAYGDAADSTHGENKNSYPVGAAYTATVPARSANTMFHAGGAEALEFWASALQYWSSTEFSPTNMVRQNSFAASEGFQGNSTKTALIRVRAVRRSII